MTSDRGACVGGSAELPLPVAVITFLAELDGLAVVVVAKAVVLAAMAAGAAALEVSVVAAVVAVVSDVDVGTSDLASFFPPPQAAAIMLPTTITVMTPRVRMWTPEHPTPLSPGHAGRQRYDLINNCKNDAESLSMDSVRKVASLREP